MSRLLVFASAAIVAIGCAGELSEADMIPRGGASGSGGAGGSGGSGATGGTGGTIVDGGGSAGNPEACVMSLMKSKSCAIVGCHGGSLPAAKLLLTDDVISKAKEQLLDKSNTGMTPGCSAGAGKLIDKAQPEKSVFYTKLLAQPPCGERMPTTGQYFSATEMACVLDWLKAVAAQ